MNRNGDCAGGGVDPAAGMHGGGLDLHGEETLSELYLISMISFSLIFAA